MRCTSAGTFVWTLFLLLVATGGAHASDRIRQAPELAATWAKLDAARSYRAGFRDTALTHSQMIQVYLNGPVPGYGTQNAQAFLPLIKTEFLGFVENPLSAPAVIEEATWGLQETLNEILTGQQLVGNDLLLKGLRVRYPIPGDPGDPDQKTLLSQSTQQFQAGLDNVIEELRLNPGRLRASGTVIPSFPFFVENAHPVSQGSGETVENEFYRFTNSVERAALAANSLGKRMFFFGNVKDVDNFPYVPDAPFGGPEDLDFNNNDIQDHAGRDEARDQFKRSAHATYLHTAVLAAVQSPKQFDDNVGYELKRQVLDAQRVFDDILAGLNPLRFQGDFIPVDDGGDPFLKKARDSVQDAIAAEDDARDAQRLYDVHQTQLASELQTQQQEYLDRLAVLTGIASVGTFYDLVDPDERARFFADAEHRSLDPLGGGEIGQARQRIELAALEAQLAQEELRQIPQRIRIEEDRAGAVSKLVLTNGAIFGALSLAEGVANAVTICACGLSSGVLTQQGALAAGVLRSARDVLTAVQEATIVGIDSSATIKNFLLSQALQLIAVERAGLIVEQEKARFHELEAELQRVARNYVTARADLASAYYQNPAYRLERDQLTEDADITFEEAMEDSYIAAKALEYEWSERFNNPVNLTNGGQAQPLGTTATPFSRAESVFTAKSAQTHLDAFLDALASWDLKMRQLRTPPNTPATLPVSLKRDILQFDSGDAELDSLRFRDFIAKHRVQVAGQVSPDLLLEFSIQITDESVFFAEPNIKIATLSANLVSVPSGSVRGPGSTSAPALVKLAMLDEAVVRTFWAEYPDDDDLITWDLSEGRTLSSAPLQATVEARIDGFANPAPSVNTALAGHSPAVSRWTLWIKMTGQNQHLLIEKLDDIEITIGYAFGHPPAVDFF